MPRFFRTYSEQINQRRAEISSAVEAVAFDGIHPDSVDRFISRIEPALEEVYAVRPAGNVTPPAYMAAVASVIVQGATKLEEVQAAREKMSALDRRCAEVVKRTNRALAGLDLPADDLLLVGQYAARLSAEAQVKLNDIASGSKGGLLDRVRAKLSQSEIARLKDDVADFNPATEASPRAVALMVLEAAEARAERRFQPIDAVRRFHDEKLRAVPSEGPLLAMAALMSHVYSDANLARLRALVARSSHSVELSVDMTEDDGSLEWAMRRRG